MIAESTDNNIKVIVLDRIADLQKNYSKVLEDYMIDIVNVMRDEQEATVSQEISSKVLELTTQLIS